MPNAEPDLFDRASQGDPVALDQLLAENLPRLQAYIRMKAGPALRARESCSDLVQSVCREVLDDLPRFEYRDESAFRHWLMQHALHKIIDRARYYSVDTRRPVQPPTDSIGESLAATYLTPSRAAIGREQLARLEREFESLPADYREVILLYRVAGLKHREIAAEMGRSEGAVRNLLYRGLARLTLALEPEATRDGG